MRSRRIPHDLAANRFAEARARLGDIPYDLTVSNPTACGFAYPPDLLAVLGGPAALEYHPDPRGPRTARQAVAAEYHRWAVRVDPDRIVLTASTSEAYGFLFRLLCDPGDAILVPSPSYPLFDHLARLDAVQALTYGLDRDGGWRIDFANLEDASDRVRAVVVVHPNNPTGSFVHPADAGRLVALCRDRGWALIADEVFLDYTLDGGPGADQSFAAVNDCLCFALGGLSKSAGLPQLKLAWIAASGPGDLVCSALEGLEYVADAYLSVSTPVAAAAPGLLAAGERIRLQIGNRCRKNLETLQNLASPEPSVRVLRAGGGWSAVLQIPAVGDDDDLCVALLERWGVAVHPGHLFGFDRGGFLVLSLLVPEAVFATGVRHLLAGVRATGAAMDRP
jgi:alanine-synthesizing transaminase